jgi:mannose-6-phosphate isomerase-like protein (cupin superfamily)
MFVRTIDWRARRIICGNDSEARSKIVVDGEAPWVERPGGSVIMEIWRIATLPPSAADDDALDEPGAAPPAGGAAVRLCTFPPESEMDFEAYEKAMIETYGHSPVESEKPTVRGMHRTDTVDVVTLLSGELYVVLDEGETLMRPGDSVVHRGTTHAWSNRSDRPATVVSVMFSATDT